MDTTVGVAVVRQAQSTKFYCGAACAVMLLSTIGRKVTQDAAYEKIRAGNVEPDAFYSDPKGLSACVDGVLTNAGASIDFEPGTAPAAASALSTVFDALSATNLPVPVLVKAGAHWVLVSSITYEPAASPSVAPTIKTVTIVDPWPTALDQTVIPADVFQEQYLLPIKFGQRWLQQFALVSKQQLARLTAVRAVMQPQMGGGGKVEDQDVIDRLGALGIADVVKILAGGVDFTPLEVTDLETESSYTIRPLDASANASLKDIILVAHDTLTGRILEVGRFGNLNYFSDTEALALARAQTAPSPSGANMATLVDPGYFYFRSRQLPSRFLVARRIHRAGVEEWLMPDGKILADRDEPTIGGQ